MDEPPPLPLELGDDTYHLVAQAGRDVRIELRRGNEVLVSIRGADLLLGSVPALEPGRSYDPYWLEAGQDVLTTTAPAGLIWHQVTAAKPVSATPTSATWDLTLTDDLHGRLELNRLASGRFELRFFADPMNTASPTSPAGAAMIPRAIAYMRVRTQIDPREGLYGMGEWPDGVNHRGKIRPMQIEIDTLESENNENHVPIPLVIGTRGWGLFVESRRVGSFNLGAGSPDVVQATFGTAEDSRDGLRVHLFATPDGKPLDALRHYYDVTGNPALPAEWAYGPWIWRDENRNQAEVEDDIAQIRSLDLATSAIWVDRPYATAVNTFDWKASDYPDPPRMIDRAHAAGLRVALWHTPYLEDSAQPLRKLADQQGFFPTVRSLLLNGWSAPIDFFNSKARAQWSTWLDAYVRQGIEGYKLDYAEDIVPSVGDSRNRWQFADGSDERRGHYQYTLEYHRLYAEKIPTPAQGGGFLLCRASRWGGQRFASVIWPGDMDATFTRHREPFKRGSMTVQGVGGLPATVVQLLTLSSSGFPFFGADTGGYRHSPPDRELYIRWFQQTALSPVMQVGDSSSQPPWVFTPDNGRDPAALDLYRVYARLHLRLFPYAWTYAQRIAQTGHPIVRPLGLAYPKLDQHPDDQYLFGEDLLVAPVVDRGATRRSLILPPGRWVDFWDGTQYEAPDAGRKIDVPAPIERLPLLVRAGAVLPMLRPTIDTLSPATDAGVDSFKNDPGPLSVWVAPADAPTTFALYDGTELQQGIRGGVYGLRIAPGTLFRRGALFQIVRRARPAKVLLDGADLVAAADCKALDTQASGYCHTSDPSGITAGTLYIKLPASTTPQQITLP